jgi:uncharacterized protein (DUF1800 family)
MYSFRKNFQAYFHRTYTTMIILLLQTQIASAECDVIFSHGFENFQSPAGNCSPFADAASTSRFLSRATFGATQADIDALTGTEVSDWIIAEFNKPANDSYMQDLITQADNNPGTELGHLIVNTRFMDDTIAAADQLRERMIFALSEIVVISNIGNLASFDIPMANYHDILATNAFGNYKDILRQVSRSPAMAMYLTFLKNQKGDAALNTQADENYAREIMQLFSIGLLNLNLDGSLQLDPQGQPVQTYDISDIKGLAKVFTGFSYESDDFFFNINNSCGSAATCPVLRHPIKLFPEFHSTLEKNFLGTTIPAATDGITSMNITIDSLFNHQNVAPFVGRQLIQRFVTSNPAPDYINRVSLAFESGQYVLPNGTTVGTGIRGDLKATIAAVLLDDKANREPQNISNTFGKVSEPYIRFAQWARAFKETTPDIAKEAFGDVRGDLRQRPFLSTSVFNFFRPGYIAPNTLTGNAGLNAPELQLANSSSVMDYINFMNVYIYQRNGSVVVDPNAGIFVNYDTQMAIADDPVALVNNIDLLLTGKRLTVSTKNEIIAILNEIPLADGDYGLRKRVHIATSLVMTSVEYLVQR